MKVDSMLSYLGCTCYEDGGEDYLYICGNCDTTLTFNEQIIPDMPCPICGK